MALGLLLACALATVLAASEAPLRVKVRVGGVGVFVPLRGFAVVPGLPAQGLAVWLTARLILQWI